jgi:hypothetical protein
MNWAMAARTKTRVGDGFPRRGVDAATGERDAGLPGDVGVSSEADGSVTP